MSTKKPDIEEVEIDMSKPAPNKRKVTSDTFWHDKDGNFVVLQMPNKLIIAWFVTFILSELIHTQPIKFILSWGAFIMLAVWAIREMREGVNYFRKSLGVLVFLLALLTRF
jgi:hypothetical protein